MTISAANEIERLVINGGITSAASIARLDKSSISRLISARADRIIKSTEPPRATALANLGAGALAAADLTRGQVRAVFIGPDDSRLLQWLSPRKTTIFPDAAIAAHCLTWQERVRAALTADVFEAMLVKPLRQAAQKMAIFLSKGPSDLREVTRLLTANPVGMNFEDTTSLSKLAAAGTPARHFLKMRDRLTCIHDASTLEDGMRKLTSWLGECHGTWADIFQPVVQFLKAYMPLLLKHPLSLTSKIPVLSRRFDGPANVYNLILARERQNQQSTRPAYGPVPTVRN